MADDPEYRGPKDHASNYVGKIFVGPDSLKTKARGNPMYDGADMDALSRVQSRIDYLKHEGILPSTYDVHSTVQLLPDRVFDTTNRATVIQAQINGFDPEGFKTGQPLLKRLFYLDPYVTCSWCNFVSFVDVMTVRRTLAIPSQTREMGLPVESLPPCGKCGKANFLQVGSHDFSEQIANRDRKARERLARQKAAAAVILRSYRAYLRRMFQRATEIARKALLALQTKASIKINNSARRRLAYRRFKAEIELREIKRASHLLLSWALLPYPKNNVKTFWFTRDIELNLVFFDYIELGFRLGFSPTRAQMEVNFAELRRRIDERKDTLLALIQRAWRGVMVRRIVKIYRKERIRLGEFVLSRVLVIQRIYRGHFVRLKTIPSLTYGRYREQAMDKYLQEAEKLAARERKKNISIKAKAAYIKDRAEERTARLTGRIDLPRDHNNRKMAAWRASPYSGDRLSTQVKLLLSQELEEIRQTKMEVEEDRDRKDFLLARIAEVGPMGYGSRSESPHTPPKIVNGFRVGDSRSSRSRGMGELMQGEVDEIMGRVIERTTHDFKGYRLLERFKEFNGGRGDGKDEEYFQRLERARAKFGAMAKVAVKKKSSRYKEYKFPVGINVNPMAFLDEDVDASLAIIDAQKIADGQKVADDGVLNERQRAAAAAAKKRLRGMG